jgi:hypothetical protein
MFYNIFSSLHKRPTITHLPRKSTVKTAPFSTFPQVKKPTICLSVFSLSLAPHCVRNRAKRAPTALSLPLSICQYFCSICTHDRPDDRPARPTTAPRRGGRSHAMPARMEVITYVCLMPDGRYGSRGRAEQALAPRLGSGPYRGHSLRYCLFDAGWLAVCRKTPAWLKERKNESGFSPYLFSTGGRSAARGRSEKFP